jgi:nicotinamidase/pyrazinamidase
MRAALLAVDVQRDFCPGGALGVNGGDEIVPGLNQVINVFEGSGLPTFCTRDWHPPDHISLKSRGGNWPPHCVQGTPGAEFHPALKIPLKAIIISKGTDTESEAYSGFEGTDLEVRLRKLGVDETFLGGLTTDYCVRESTLDALKAGFAANVLEDWIQAVNARPGDGDRAIADMRKAGAKFTTSSALVKRLASTQQ